MTGWQPIETAPRDGTWVLLGYYSEGSKGPPVVACWLRSYWWGGGVHFNDGPSHWQLLLEPPK